MHLIRGGKDIRIVQELLGYNSLKTTENPYCCVGRGRDLESTRVVWLYEKKM
ncbi:MAG: hypothetical protein KDC31_13050 [Saprospiraceae bacterium]|nr:hypothetical protein [Candidatus Parvibacillus calidus]MBX2938160.1 hypothetical protein [Saprospiraceae bacterium]MBX7179260.1 hypothetical protein [Saprospiraceae bacterium]MCB0592218.1 hypothetical protein [Saprospiraceae bacterium]MCO5281883.1 hypothetical protein [Saprospiraceae bacterium]